MPDRRQHWDHTPSWDNFPQQDQFATLTDYFAACHAWNEARRGTKPPVERAPIRATWKGNEIKWLFAPLRHESAEEN